MEVNNEPPATAPPTPITVPQPQTIQKASTPPNSQVGMQTYLAGFKRQSFLLVFAAQSIIIFIIAVIAVLTNQYEVTSLAFWLMVVVSFLVGIGIHFALIIYMSRPAIDLVKAVVHVAGETTDTTPPNPNAPRYSRNGFREILQTIYELATVVKPETVHSEMGDILTEGLGHSATGVIILDHNRIVIYRNLKAPVTINTKDQKVPQLLFSGELTLDKWLDRCEEHEVNAEYTWYRVPNKLPGEESRKIYDVTASYQKGSRAETVLTLFDRTQTYMPEEEDMD